MQTNNLLSAIADVRAAELIGEDFGRIMPTGLIVIEEAIEILQRFEIALRTECEEKFLKETIENKYY